MARRELLPHAKSAATALMLLTLLGSGCATRRRAVTSPAREVVSAIDPMTDPADRARDECEDFGCEP